MVVMMMLYGGAGIVLFCTVRDCKIFFNDAYLLIETRSKYPVTRILGQKTNSIVYIMYIFNIWNIKM